MVEETDLFIRASADVTARAKRAIQTCRWQITAYIRQCPEFQTALRPLPMSSQAPPIVQEMLAAAARAGVGPFAAVAGAIAEYVGRDVLQQVPDVIVENGGDIFAASPQSRVFGIYAADSPFTGRMALHLEADRMPCGICTSSGTVGHSLSFGKADAAVAIARSTALADACATALSNMVSTPADIAKALRFAEHIEGLDGAVIIVGQEIGAWGQVELVRSAAT